MIEKLGEYHMTDRVAVLTTLNGRIVEWKMFENRMKGMEYYSAGVNKLSEMISRTGDAKWEVLFCDVNQFARSFPESEANGSDLMSDISDLQRFDESFYEDSRSDILFTE